MLPSTLQGLTEACDLNKATLSNFISNVNPTAYITDFPVVVSKALTFFTSDSSTGNVRGR